MPNTGQNVEMWEGEYKEIPFTVQDADGVAVNLTGATLTWKLCRNGPDSTVLLTKTSGSGISLVVAASGTAKVTLAEADTADLGGVAYYHELVVKDSSGHSELGFVGSFLINVSAIL